MGVYTGTPPTFLSGELPDSTKFDEITSFMTAATAAWTVATPTWTCTAGTPAIGNGTLVGRYRLIGKTKDFEIHLTAGGTTTFGTAGNIFFFTLPGGGTAAETFTGSGFFFDASAGANYALISKIDSGSTTVRLWRADASPSSELLNNSPVVMATSDQIMFSGTVEIT